MKIKASKNRQFWKPSLLLIFAICLTGCSNDDVVDVLDDAEDAIEDEVVANPDQPFDADVNGDGELNILILGTSKSINNSAEAFAPDNIALELNKILSEDANNNATVYVEAEDIYQSKDISTALGSGGTAYDYIYYSHSLV